MQPSKEERTPMHKGNTKDLSSPAKSQQGKPPAPAKEYLVMPEAPRQAKNTHHALHKPALNPHANPQTRGPQTKTLRPQPSSHLDHYVSFCHSWCMNSIDYEDTYQVVQNLRYLS